MKQLTKIYLNGKVAELIRMLREEIKGCGDHAKNDRFIETARDYFANQVTELKEVIKELEELSKSL